MRVLLLLEEILLMQLSYTLLPNLAGKIVSTNSLKNSNLIAIRKVESQLPTGHFALWHQMEDMQLFGKVDLLRVN